MPGIKWLNRFLKLQREDPLQKDRVSGIGQTTVHYDCLPGPLEYSLPLLALLPLISDGPRIYEASDIPRGLAAERFSDGPLPDAPFV